MRGLKENLTGWIPDIRLPTLTREVEIAVYMIHNSGDAEDYVFLFDFEEFVDRSKAGMFVRPVLRIFAGRDDFSRSRFAREFRAVFAAEFDRMRAEVARGKDRRGWLDWNLGLTDAFDMVGSLVANMVLAVALNLGRQVFGGLSLPGFLKGKSDEARLADEIDRTKTQVETALERIEITIHRELYDHAYRDGVWGKISGMDRDAWPLPAYVREHLDGGRSGSWW